MRQGMMSTIKTCCCTFPETKCQLHSMREPKELTTTKKLIIIEGNISAGKSVLCSQLGKRLNCRTFIEPSLENPYLERFYADKKKWALTMQLYLLRIRFVTYVEALRLLFQEADVNKQDYKGVILDRSIFSDVVFAEQNFSDGNISKEGMQYYWKVRDHMMEGLPYPDLCVYLDVDPDICLYRINKVRQRECESGISIEYLRGLQDKYQNLLKDLEKNKTKVICLNWNNFGDTDEIVEIVSQLPAASTVSKNCIDFLFDEKEITKRLQLSDNAPIELYLDNKKET